VSGATTDRTTPSSSQPRAPHPPSAPTGDPGARGWRAWVLPVLCAAVVGLGFRQAQPPSVVPDTAPTDRFSAERAEAHLEALTREPRPVGSAGHARARLYILSQLEMLGVETSVHDTVAVQASGSGMAASGVQNILGRIPGTSPGALAVLLMAHYDAVPGSYGAGDDASGVAAILETVRALRAQPPVTNDILILISDSEETGLHGAVAFLATHPWAQRIGVALNVEARGVTGPSLLFQTSLANGRLIQHVAASGAPVRATSLMGEVYRSLPNDTDLTPFLRADIPGLNFAFIGGHPNYHTPLDRLDELDRRSVQHHGEYLMALARQLGNADLQALRGPDRVYFDVPVAGLVHYPTSWAMPLAILLLVLVAAVSAVGLRRGRIHLRGLLHGTIALLAMVGGGAAVGWATWRLALLIQPHHREMVNGSPYADSWFWAAAALVLLLSLRVTRWALSRTTAATLAVPPLVLAAVAGIAVAAMLPGGSYLLLWPALGTLAATALLAWREPPSWVHRAGMVAMAAPALLLLPVLARMLDVALTPYAMYLGTAVIGLAMALVAPIVAQMPVRQLEIGAATALGALVFIAAAVTGGFGDSRPYPASLAHLAEPDSGRAWWVSWDHEVTDWTRPALGEMPGAGAPPGHPSFSTRRAGAMHAAAPTVAVTPALATLTTDSVAADGGRWMSLQVRSPRGGQRLMVTLATPGARIEELSMAGEAVGAPAGVVGRRPIAVTGPGRMLMGFAPPAAGFTLRFRTGSQEPLEFAIYDFQYGFPQGASPGPRPDGVTGKPQVPTDMSIVRSMVRG
jgi:hypothetical protein